MQEKLNSAQIIEILSEELTDVINDFGLMDCEIRAIINLGLSMWTFQRTCSQTLEHRNKGYN